MNTTLPQDEAPHVTAVITAAQALLDAFGGNTPDWLTGEAAALDGAIAGYWARREAVTVVEGSEIVPATAPARVLIAMEGGLVQAIVTDSPVDVVVVDYDVEGADDDEIVEVPQDEGRVADAIVNRWTGPDIVTDGAFIAGAINAMEAR